MVREQAKHLQVQGLAGLDATRAAYMLYPLPTIQNIKLPMTPSVALTAHKHGICRPRRIQLCSNLILQRAPLPHSYTSLQLRFDHEDKGANGMIALDRDQKLLRLPARPEHHTKPWSMQFSIGVAKLVLSQKNSCCHTRVA